MKKEKESNKYRQAARAGKDLSREELARLCSVTRQTISAIEKGDYHPTISLCIAICMALAGRWMIFSGLNKTLPAGCLRLISSTSGILPEFSLNPSEESMENRAFDLLL